MAQVKVKAILSFPHLFQPRAIQQGDDPKYSCSGLIRKDDPALGAVQQAIETEKQNGFPSGFPGNGKVCLQDGAVKYPDDTRMHGFMILTSTAKADQKPPVVDANLQPVMDPALAYPGAVAWMVVNTFSYSQPTSKGVSCGLNGIMLTGEEGELGRLDNKPTVEQMFAGLGGAPAATPAATAPATIPGAAPNQVPAAPTPAAPAPAAPQTPTYTMTAAAGTFTREQYHAQGWTDEMLLQQGMMITLSFA